MRLPFRAVVCFGFFAMVVVAGCSGPRPLAERPGLPDAFPHHSLEQIYAALRPDGLDTLHSFKAKANLSVRTPQQNANLSADVQHRRNDSLYMTVSPGLGIEAARVLITPDSFFVHDRIRKRLMYGGLADASAHLPIPITGDDIFLGFLGFLPPEETTAWQLSADSSYYQLRDPDQDRLFVIDPAIWRVVRYEERDEEGTLVEERRFEDFDLFEHHFLPRRVVVRRPQEANSATLYYRDLDLNPASLSFPLRIGDGAERVLVTESQ